MKRNVASPAKTQEEKVDPLLLVILFASIIFFFAT